jgi:hypothetical protein
MIVSLLYFYWLQKKIKAPFLCGARVQLEKAAEMSTVETRALKAS